MKTAAIIAEYNPFHNGHFYLAEQARALTGADYVIAVMSGDFTQRGEPAIADKFTRAKAAVSCGIDAVFELPVLYAVSSAERFAAGAVSLLTALSCVDALVFGSECGSLSELKRAALFLSEETEAFRTALNAFQKSGLSYPAALEKAIQETSGDLSFSPGLFSSPNNVLALEYLKAIRRTSSPLLPLTIPRIGAGHHETAPVTNGQTNRTYASAKSIRSLLTSDLRPLKEVPSAVAPLLPPPSLQTLSAQYGRRFPIVQDDFSLLLSYALSLESADSLSGYLDVSPELADRIVHSVPGELSVSRRIEALKHRRYTYARISRALNHILLHIPASLCSPSLPDAPYARLLAMRTSASPLLRRIQERSRIPIITKAADHKRQPGSRSFELFSLDVFAANLYESVVSSKYHVPLVDDIRHSPVIFSSDR